MGNRTGTATYFLSPCGDVVGLGEALDNVRNGLGGIVEDGTSFALVVVRHGWFPAASGEELWSL